MRKTILVAGILSVVIIVLIPFAIDWLIIGNGIPSNISNSDWVSFLGSYIGAIVGATVSVIAIVVTVYFTKSQIEMTKQQYEEEKRLNYIPILEFEIMGVNGDSEPDAIVMDVEYTLKKNQSFSSRTIDFNICNLGLGAAINLKYGMKVDEKVQDGVFWIQGMQTIKSQQSTSQKITIHIPETGHFKPTLLVYYEDILGNEYCKSIDIIINTNEDSSVTTFFIIKQDRGQLCENAPKKEKYYVVCPVHECSANEKNQEE